MVGRVKKVRVEQKEDTLYLYQPPRSEWAPSLSPDCLKLETYLRIVGIPYEHVDYQTLAVPAGGQLPFCKMNGKEVPYSSHMINEIAQHFNKEATKLSFTQNAFEALIEGRLHWVLIYIRATQANQLPPSDVFQGRWGQILRPLTNKVVANKLKTKADYQGIGRENASDVIATGKKDLRAISEYLDGGQFLGGDKPNELDATAFAHLSQFWYIPIDNELKTYMKEECPNLVEYLDRIKTQYWTDWEEKCRKPTPPRRCKTKEEPSPTAATGPQENGDDTKKSLETTEPIESTTTAVNGGCPEKEIATEKIESTVEIVTTAEPNVAPVNGTTEKSGE